MFFPVMAFGISSSVYPRAIFAATFAMGYPVALLASAEERLTRGLTLDYTVFKAVWLQGILNVTSTCDSKLCDNIKSRSTKHLIFFISQESEMEQLR